MRVTYECISTCKFFLSIYPGARYDVSELLLVPFPTVVCSHPGSPILASPPDRKIPIPTNAQMIPGIIIQIERKLALQLLRGLNDASIDRLRVSRQRNRIDAVEIVYRRVKFACCVVMVCGGNESLVLQPVTRKSLRVCSGERYKPLECKAVAHPIPTPRRRLRAHIDRSPQMIHGYRPYSLHDDNENHVTIQ